MNLKDHFPRASKAFLDANSAPITQWTKENAIANPTDAPKAKSEARRGRMNKTEAEFAMILEAMKRKGEILRYEFEGITLRFAGVKYTPDFTVIYPFVVTHLYTIPKVKFVEVKGAFMAGNRERAVERFRHAKTYYEDVFQFELHQKTKEGWKQII